MLETFLLELHSPDFWLAIGQVIWIDALLSGDNALVIAMACRGLSPKHKMWGMIFGAGAAVALRILFTGIISQLISLPYLKIAGAIALVFVAAKMVQPDDGDTDVKVSDKLLTAIGIIVMADIVMSLDNMIAVAAVAKGSLVILALGLLISIPMIVSGAAVITLVLNKLPALIWCGAALLGYIAGEMWITDPALGLHTAPSYYFGVMGSLIVLGTAVIWRTLSFKKETA